MTNPNNPHTQKNEILLISTQRVVDTFRTADNKTRVSKGIRIMQAHSLYVFNSDVVMHHSYLAATKAKVWRRVRPDRP